MCEAVISTMQELGTGARMSRGAERRKQGSTEEFFVGVGFHITSSSNFIHLLMSALVDMASGLQGCSITGHLFRLLWLSWRVGEGREACSSGFLCPFAMSLSFLSTCLLSCFRPICAVPAPDLGSVISLRSPPQASHTYLLDALLTH